MIRRIGNPFRWWNVIRIPDSLTRFNNKLRQWNEKWEEKILHDNKLASRLTLFYDETARAMCHVLYLKLICTTFEQTIDIFSTRIWIFWMFVLQHEKSFRSFLTALNLATNFWNIHVSVENEYEIFRRNMNIFWTIKNVPILDRVKKTVCKYRFYNYDLLCFPHSKLSLSSDIHQNRYQQMYQRYFHQK